MHYNRLFVVGPPEKGADGVSGFSAIYRANYNKDGARPAADTTYSLFELSAQKYGDRPCLGWREQTEDGEWTPYKFITYKETQQKIAIAATGFAAFGGKKDTRVGIYGPNCPEWMIALQVCNRQSYVCVPLYDTLGDTAVEYQVNHANIEIIVLAGSKLPELCKVLQRPTGIKGVIYWGKAADADVKSAKAKCANTMSWSEFLAAYEGKPIVDAVPPTPEDMSTIMYTSGTTGNPKGVVITHSNLTHMCDAVVQFLEHAGYKVEPDDKIISYLPMAHIFDRMLQETFIQLGSGIGYWRGDVAGLVDDIGMLKPSILVGVPRVFDRIRKRVLGQIEEASFLRRTLFNYAYSSKLKKQKAGGDHVCGGLFDKLVFSKIKARLGGNTKAILSGAAPLSYETEEFLRVTTMTPVVQGYGLTETSAGIMIAEPNVHSLTGTVGLPLAGMEIRLEGIPEMGYSPFHDPPRGEVCVRGPNVFKEYYKDKEKTDEVLDQAGFFHTGDVAELLPDGSFKIIDRKKNIFKLAQGEYIAAEKLEQAYKSCEYIEQIWIYGNSFESSIIAVVVPSSKLMAKAAENGQPNDRETVCNSDFGRTTVLQEMQAVGREKKLRGFEIVRGVILDAHEWTPENMMTPSFKLKRPTMQKHYQAEIDALYKSINAGK